MARKDFSNINTNNVYDTLAEATARPVEAKQEPIIVEPVPQAQATQVIQVADIVNAVLDRAEQKAEQKHTKRTKSKRINMAFTDDNYQFIKTLAKVRGQTITDFVNDVIENSREQNKETYQKAKEFLELI